jgi:hypothetical protein
MHKIVAILYLLTLLGRSSVTIDCNPDYKFVLWNIRPVFLDYFVVTIIDFSVFFIALTLFLNL